MRVLLPLVMLAGCDGIFDIVEVSSTQTDGGTADGMIGGDGGDALCATPVLHWTFDDDSVDPCDGSTFGTVTQHDNALYIPADGVMESASGCSAYLPYMFKDGGVYTHVTEYLTSPSTYTLLKVRSNNASQPAFETTISAEDGKIIFFGNNATVISTSVASPGWWRLRRPGGGNDIVGEKSADGVTWTQLGHFNAPVLPDSFAVDIVAGVNAPTTPSEAAFDELVICE